MKLTLIQEQTLQALAHAQTVGGINAVDGVSCAAVQRSLALRRPRKTSERYVGQILRELSERRVDGLPIVERRRSRRSRWLATRVGLDHSFRRDRETYRLDEDKRRWDELNPTLREKLAAADWVRRRDGLWNHPEHSTPMGFGTALAVEDVKAAAG